MRFEIVKNPEVIFHGSKPTKIMADLHGRALSKLIILQIVLLNVLLLKKNKNDQQ